MALIKCPECKKDVSEHAETCPHCGLKMKTLTAGMQKFSQKLEAIKEEAQRDPEGVKASIEEKRLRNNPNLTAGQALKIVAALLIVCFVGVWLYVKLVDEPRDKRRAAEETRKNNPEELKKARIKKGFSSWDGSHIQLTKVIKDSMNDPNSFELVACNYFDMGDHIVVIEDFRVKNALGGMELGSVKAKCDLDGNVLKVMNVKQLK